MKNILSVFLAAALLIALLTACGSTTAQTQGDGGAGEAAGSDKAAVVLKIAHAGSSLEDDPQNVAAYHFEKILEERSDGYYDVQVYPNKQLGDTTTIIEGVQMGTIEMADIESGPTVGFVKAETLWDLPYLFTSLEQAHEVIDGEVGDAIAKKFEDIGITVLGYNDGGFRYFTNSVRPIRTPEDLKGLKIRVMDSEVMVNSINAFGASAVPMAFAEVYSALQQGAIDGQENPFNVIYTQAYYEVQKYLSLSEHFFYLRHYMVNSNFYANQPEEMQKLIKECAMEACQVQREACYNAQVQYQDELVSKYNMEVNDVDKEAFAQIAREQVWPQYYELIGDGDAEAGKALLDQIVAVGEKYKN